MDLDVILDRVVQHAQNEAVNEFLAGASRCDAVGGDFEAEGQGSSISVKFGGNQVDVQIVEGVCDELTGHPIFLHGWRRPVCGMHRSSLLKEETLQVQKGENQNQNRKTPTQKTKQKTPQNKTQNPQR